MTNQKPTYIRITQFKQKIILLLIYTIIVFVARKSGVTCIFMYLLGFPCPGCGITRACLAALKFDFAVAASFNIMFWSVPLLIAYFMCDGKMFKGKWTDNIILCCIAIGFLINWVYKISLYFI